MNLPDIEGYDATWVPVVDEWKVTWICPKCGHQNRDYEGPSACDAGNGWDESEEPCDYRCNLVAGGMPSKLDGMRR